MATLIIGERFWNTEFFKPDWDVAQATHPDAPTFSNDVITEPQANWRLINVVDWLIMVEACSLGGDWLIGRQTGWMVTLPTDIVHPLAEEYFSGVNEAYRVRSIFCEDDADVAVKGLKNSTDQYNTSDRNPNDSYIARLRWLRFWMRWALDTCEHPSIVVWR